MISGGAIYSMTFYGIESGYLSEPLLYEIGGKLNEVVISSSVCIEFLPVTGPDGHGTGDINLAASCLFRSGNSLSAYFEPRERRFCLTIVKNTGAEYPWRFVDSVRNLVREKFKASMYKERAVLRESGQMFYFNGGNNGK